MGRKENRDLKKAVNEMNMNDMVRISELNDFRVLANIGFLNKLAMIMSQDHPLYALSSAEELRDEGLAELLTNHIVYHDEGEFKDEDGNSAGFPIIASINGRDENGKLNVSYADSLFGSVIHCRLILDEHNPFITVFCEGSDKTILVTDGEWFTA